MAPAMVGRALKARWNGFELKTGNSPPRAAGCMFDHWIAGVPPIATGCTQMGMALSTKVSPAHASSSVVPITSPMASAACGGTPSLLDDLCCRVQSATKSGPSEIGDCRCPEPRVKNER